MSELTKAENVATLDRNSAIPLYVQLRQLFLDKIEAGGWPLGEIIPREVDLAEDYKLSRYTVRQALDDLVQAGYLVRTKKRGTIVSRPKVEQNLSRFYSFAHDLAAKGLKPISRTLTLEEIVADEELVQMLKLDETTEPKVWHLRRLRMVNYEPLIIESSYLHFNKPVDMQHYDWRVVPLYDVLEKYYDIVIERAKEFLEPVKLDATEAQLLEVAPETPAFRVERLTYATNGQIFERRISLIRGDRYRFYVELPKIELLKQAD
jgi:GntR family transcriptional regulator